MTWAVPQSVLTHAFASYRRFFSRAITPEVCEAVSEALEAHELVKIKLLKNGYDEVKEPSRMLAERTRAELVTVIGRTAVLYRPSKEKKRIELP